MASTSAKKPAVNEKDLRYWKLLSVFQEAVEKVYAKAPLHPTFEDKRRQLDYGSYLSLFLFGLLNPVVESMRGLCAVSRLERVQRELCAVKVSLGSFSEMQHVLEPALLHQVFQQIYQKTKTNHWEDKRLAALNLIIQDGSLWRALPRMAWAEYGVGPKGEAKGVRLHLRFNLVEDKPLQAKVTPGKGCERKAMREMCVAGQTNVGDRFYGVDYQLFGDIARADGFFVFRIKEQAVVHVEEELPLSQEDRASGVVRHVWARLGAHEHERSIRLRLIEIKGADEHIFLVTNLPLEKASAELVGLIYRRRWKIELYFRWIKCILKCRHFFAESPEGVATVLYLALIASLLCQFYGGQRPNKRLMEMIHFYLLGWASEKDLVDFLQEQLARDKAGKKR